MAPNTGADAISILYVEDDQSSMELLVEMLMARYPEHRFLKACNGQQGLDIFREEQPAIVITDISMPVMDGITMAAGIKDIAPETIIIALSAHSETDNLLRAIESGINHYVLKPVVCEQLFKILDQSIATVRKEQQLHNQYEQICRLNVALQSRTEELETLNRELEAFNYTVAHDLRSPLVCIGGFTQHLLDKLTGNADQTTRDHLNIIQAEAVRMNSLIEALLNFSSYSRKNFVKQWTDFSSIANEIRCTLLAREPQRKVNFTIATGIHGFADPVLIGVVLENLFGNAWKFTANSSAASIEFGVNSTENDNVYYVRDNGEGFDQLEAASLFAPFTRLKNTSGAAGFGIGLATVSRIIQRHGGKIWAEGEKGRGATFYFSL